MIAKAQGANVYAVDINDAALAIAQSLGAETINSSKVDPVAFMQNLGEQMLQLTHSAANKPLAHLYFHLRVAVAIYNSACYLQQTV